MSRDEPTELGIDLLVEEVGDAAEHLLQRAGRLAHLDHLDRNGRKDPAFVQRRGQCLALAHTLANQRLTGRAKNRFPSARPATSRALTRGIPPPSSVASVRVNCDVANRAAIVPTVGTRRSHLVQHGRSARSSQPIPAVQHTPPPIPTKMKQPIASEEH